MTDLAGAVRPVCSWCGSVNVSRDAWAKWNVARQRWVLRTVFDDGRCHACDAERVLVDVPVEPDQEWISFTRTA